MVPQRIGNPIVHLKASVRVRGVVETKEAALRALRVAAPMPRWRMQYLLRFRAAFIAVIRLCNTPDTCQLRMTLSDAHGVDELPHSRGVSFLLIKHGMAQENPRAADIQ